MIGKELNTGNLGRTHRVAVLPNGGAVGMDRRVVRLTSTEASRRARMALSARLHRHPLPAYLPPRDEAEAIMTVSFEGLSEREQEAALAAFPGGKRFVLEN
jgi:hypothetical protein